MPTLTRVDFIQIVTDAISRIQETRQKIAVSRDELNKAYERYVATEHKKLLTKP